MPGGTLPIADVANIASVEARVTVNGDFLPAGEVQGYLSLRGYYDNPRPWPYPVPTMQYRTIDDEQYPGASVSKVTWGFFQGSEPSPNFTDTYFQPTLKDCTLRMDVSAGGHVDFYCNGAHLGAIDPGIPRVVCGDTFRNVVTTIGYYLRPDGVTPAYTRLQHISFTDSNGCTNSYPWAAPQETANWLFAHGPGLGNPWTIANGFAINDGGSGSAVLRAWDSCLLPGADAFEDAASQPVVYGATDGFEIQRRGYDPQIATPVVTTPVGETDDAGSVNAFKLPGQHVCLFYVADRSPATVVQATSIDGELTFTRTDTGITGYWIAEAQLLSLDNLVLLMLYDGATQRWAQSVGAFDVANNRYGNFTTPSPTALKGYPARGHLREEHDGQLHFAYLDATRQMKTAVCRQPRADGKMSWS